MKRGFSVLIILAVVGLLVIAGISGFVVAKNYTSLTKPRAFNFLNSSNNSSQDLPSVSPNIRIPPPRLPSPSPESQNQAAVASPASGNTAYNDPLGNYSIILPYNWIVDSTVKATTYSTTEFTGSQGHISITTGTGKDPIGGCSENSNIVLAQKTILGCFLLQKDGSQILTRGYTNTSAGKQLTIEAYINPPLGINKQPILNIIKTILIN